MFVKRSRYDSVVKEASGYLDEIQVLRDELKRSMDKSEKKDKIIDSLYSDAKIHASSISKMALELKEEKKNSQRLDQLKQDLKTVKFDLAEYMDPSPTDPEQRALYVGRIAGYFNGGLRDYINHLMSTFKAEIARFPLTERETDFFRSGINLCYLLVEWGDKMIQEHYANAREEQGTDTVDTFDASPDEDEAVENIKKTVNKEE